MATEPEKPPSRSSRAWKVKCWYCARRFKTRLGMYQHIDKAHGKERKGA